MTEAILCPHGILGKCNCIECDREYRRKYYWNNVEVSRAKGRIKANKCRLEHPERVRANSEKYRLKHPEAKERHKEYMKKYHQEHREHEREYQRNRERKWRSEHRELYNKRQREWRRKNKEYYNELHKKYKKKWMSEHPEKTREMNAKQYSKRRKLGFVPLNNDFKGSHAHHIDKIHVVYIPMKLHMSVFHNVWTGEGMEEINDKVFEWLENKTNSTQAVFAMNNLDLEYSPTSSPRKISRSGVPK